MVKKQPMRFETAPLSPALREQYLRQLDEEEQTLTELAKEVAFYKAQLEVRTVRRDILVDFLERAKP